MSLDALGLRSRTSNVLMDGLGNDVTISELKTCTTEELLALRGFGLAMLCEVLNALAKAKKPRPRPRLRVVGVTDLRREQGL